MRRRDPRSLGSAFWNGYRRRRHPRSRRPGFDGYVAQIDGLPLLYRRALLGNGIVVDEPEPSGAAPEPEPDTTGAEPAAASAGGDGGADSGGDGGAADTDSTGMAGGADAGPEQEQITRTYRARLNWSPAIPLRAVQKVSGGGIYVVEKGGLPIYVGQADGFARRWVVRLEVLRQLAVDPSPYTLRIARITAADSPVTGEPGARLRLRSSTRWCALF